MAVLGATALLAASCSSNRTAPSTTSAPHSRAPSATTQASTTTRPASTTTTCQPSYLDTNVSGSGGAAGTIELTFTMTDVTSLSCTMQGYPGMLLLGANGAALPTTVVRGGALSFDNLEVTLVTLRLDESAYFNVAFSDVAGTGTCSTASQVEITPPNDTEHAVVPVANLAACNNGLLAVSPVFSSTNVAGTQTTAPPLP
ncbi:MAG: DUF4232 domain-containing protein [Acidimicrobiales bacterium]